MSNKNEQNSQNADVALMSPATGEGTAENTAGRSGAAEKGGDSGNTAGGSGANGKHSVPGKHTSRSSMSGKGRKRLAVSLAVAGGVLIAAVAAAFFAISRLTVPINAEVGASVDLSRFTEGLAGVICRVEGGDGGDASAAIPTDKIGDHELSLTFFGFIGRSVPVLVRDTTAPELVLRNVRVSPGLSVTPEDFVVKVSDSTAVKLRFKDDPGPLDCTAQDFETTDSIERPLTVIAADEGGNETAVDTMLYVVDPRLFSVEAELGVNIEDVRAILTSRYQSLAGADLDWPDVTKCGEYTLRVEQENGELSLFGISVRDTNPPEAKVTSLDVRLGDIVVDDDIVSDIVDESPVTLTVGDKSTDKAGPVTVPVTLEDAEGNRTELEAQLYVHDVPRELEIERGMTQSELTSLLTNGDASLSVAPGFGVSALVLGENSVTLRGAYSELVTAVTVRDTTPPVLTLRDVTVIANRGVSPGDFVVSCTDASAVSFSFDGSVSAMSAGVSTVTVAAADEAGNVTKAQAKLTVIVDTVAPLIHGVRDITTEAGRTPSFSSGVYAVDDIDGNVSVSVDSSAVNTAVEGSYTVYYSASDRAGNTARASAKVTVGPVSLNTVYSMADSILAQITNPKMSARQKAWAIYQWCSQNIRYSTTTSYLMGNFVQSAYSGLRTRAGNCYVYYAVASCMLTRCGIENIEISRNIPGSPHYWNLVKMDGAWYHFDSCPHFRYAPLTAFLLTDAQVAEYSEENAPGYYSFDKSKYPCTP